MWKSSLLLARPTSETRLGFDRLSSRLEIRFADFGAAAGLGSGFSCFGDSSPKKFR